MPKIVPGNSSCKYQRRIQDFLRGGLNIEVISEAGGLGCSPPKITGCFINITPKSCLMEDLGQIQGGFNQIWSRGVVGGRYRLFSLIKY